MDGSVRHGRKMITYSHEMLNEANKSRYYSNELLHSISNKLYSIKKIDTKATSNMDSCNFFLPKI
jgi:hypothetical protein